MTIKERVIGKEISKQEMAEVEKGRRVSLIQILEELLPYMSRSTLSKDNCRKLIYMESNKCAMDSKDTNHLLI